MPLTKWSFGLTYLALLAARACFALYGTGYIHPDENFQNAEVTAGPILGLHTLETWEWQSDYPVRSFLPPLVTTGIPFALSRLLCGDIHPAALLKIERVVFLGLSLFLDCSVYALVPKQTTRRYALLLLASSHVQIFQIRPFSNSLEAILVALSLVSLTRCRTSRANLHVLAVLFVFGMFTRPTFIAFALPIGLQVLRPLSDLSTLIRRVLPPLLTAFLVFASAALFDTYHFHGSLEWSKLVVTPFNFVAYNLSADNLAEHGLHPRWLHLFVNLPMIIGPGLLLYGILAAREAFIGTSVAVKENKGTVSQNPQTRDVDRTAAYIIVSALSVLSLQPHQEPRFLTPLLVPSIVLVANSSYMHRLRRTFWVVWIITNIVLSGLFGVFHQGGVVPSLFHVHDRIAVSGKNGDVNVVYWKTYMPPRHLLGIPQADVHSGHINLTDLSGASAAETARALHAISTSARASTDILYLVTPPHAKTGLPSPISGCLALERLVFPHLDLDHLGESVEAGWPNGLGLGVWVANPRCISTQVLEMH